MSENILKDNVAKAVICLGTNDISKNKSDTDQVILSVISAVEKVTKSFPNAQIGICSIIPRKGKSLNIQTLNTASSSVNSFLKKMCEKDSNLEYIDLWTEFTNNDDHPIRTLYDTNDHSGVHINTDGAEVMADEILEFILSDSEVTNQTPLKKNKRTRSVTSSTPDSAVKQHTKMQKSD